MTVQLGIKNSGRHPGRSMLCAALVGCACFVIVAVGANRHVEQKQGAVPQKESGAGGFALVAESDIPLHHDLNSREGQFELGFSESDSGRCGELLKSSRSASYRGKMQVASTFIVPKNLEF